jgi:hypothetical protein
VKICRCGARNYVRIFEVADWRRYSDLKIGDTFPASPARYQVTEEVVAAYDEISLSSLVSDGVAGVGSRRTASPMLAALYIRGAQNALKGPPGGIHAKQHFTFFRSVGAGDELSTVLTIREKFEKKGRNFIVCETETTNQNGEKVSLGRITSIWGKEA